MKEKLINLIKEVDLVIEEIKETLTASRVVPDHRQEISFILIKIRRYQENMSSLTDKEGLKKKVMEITEILSDTERLTENIVERGDAHTYMETHLFDKISLISNKVSNLVS